MKILHLVSGRSGGGAARGAYCLHTALREMGLDSTILTNSRDIPSSVFVESLAETFWKNVKCLALPHLGALPTRLYRHRLGHIFSTGFEGLNVLEHSAYRKADLIHLHWINGLVSTRVIGRMTKPIVWTMRDMWPFTGGCHYSLDCERYSVGCGKCPELGSARLCDLSRMVARSKARKLPKRVHPVGISGWLTECARKSRILGNTPVCTISNNIDTRALFPIEKQVARSALHLSDDMKIVLVGAQRVADFYKGFDLFVAAISHMDKRRYHFVFFGAVERSILDELDIKFTALGSLFDTITLRLVYSAADVFVAPSRMDAFGKTLAEAMACGTPVVSFDATGPKDIVRHRQTGYSAKAFEARDLANGIEWVLSLSRDEYDVLSRAAREHVVTTFDSRVIASQYVSLYKRILGQPCEGGPAPP